MTVKSVQTFTIFWALTAIWCGCDSSDLSDICLERACLGACNAMIDTKLDKYDEIASHLDAEIVPAVLETYGGSNQAVQEAIHCDCKLFTGRSLLPLTRHEILRGLIVEVSTILQLWNARLITRRDDE